METVEEVAKKLEGRGFETIQILPGSTYLDNSTLIIIPSRGTMHTKVVHSLLMLAPPMNQKRAIFFASGHEVGKAYNALITNILANPELSKYKMCSNLPNNLTA